MPRNANGVYSQPDGTKATPCAIKHDELTEDIGNALTGSVPRDGSAAMTGDLDMGGQSINNVNLVDGRDVSVDGATLDALGNTVIELGEGNDMVGWRVRPTLLISDYQPMDDQIVRGRLFLERIGQQQPQLRYGRNNGDVIDRGSDYGTDAEPPYGYDEYRSDIETFLPNIPWDQFRHIPGNHDRSGAGIGQHPDAWTLNDYRKHIGQEFWAERSGNWMEMGLGDMAGSVDGEIMPSVTAAAKRVWQNNADAFGWLHIHQPISGTYDGKTEENTPNMVQHNSALLVDLLQSCPNIIGVMYGHVGSRLQFHQEIHYNIPHTQMGTHIPTNVRAGRDDEYFFYTLTHGATSITVEQWNSASNGGNGAKLQERVFNLPRALALSPETIDLTSQLASTYRRTQTLPFSDFRDGNTVPVDTPLIVNRISVEDRALSNIQVGHRLVPEALGFPGGGSVVLPGSTYITAAPNGGVAGDVYWAFENRNGSDKTPDVDGVLVLLNNGLSIDALRVMHDGGVNADFVSDWITVGANEQDIPVVHGLGTLDFMVQIQFWTGAGRIYDSPSLWDRENGERYGTSTTHDTTKIYISTQNNGPYEEDNHGDAVTTKYTTGQVRVIARKFRSA